MILLNLMRDRRRNTCTRPGLFVVPVAVLLFVFGTTNAQNVQDPAAIVVRPPAITSTLSSQPLRLTCVAYGLPVPAIIWTTTDGRNLTAEAIAGGNANKVRITARNVTVNGTVFLVSVLELCTADASDSTTYRCTASNGVSGDPIAKSSAEFAINVTTMHPLFSISSAPASGSPTNNQEMLITTALTVTSVVSGGTTFFVILIFTIILTAVCHRNKHRKNVEHLQAIYEPIDLPSIPPQLPPRQPRQVPIMQDNPAYVQVDLTVNPAYTSMNETMFNSVSDGALTVAVSHDKEKCADDTTSGYEEIAESTELTEDDRQSPHIKLRTAEDSLPLPTMNPLRNMIVNDYGKLPSAAVLKSTLNPVSTMVSATNLTFDGVQKEKSCACHFSVGEKKTLRHAHSDTNMLQSMIDEHPIIRFSSADNFPL